MWAGTAINDTSSVVAAGQTWASAHGSDTALNYATIVKLTRTLAIIPICLGLAYITSKTKNTAADVKITSIFPMFILYFVIAAIFNTLAGESLPVLAQLPSIGKFMIAMAMAAIGLNTNRQTDFARPCMLDFHCTGKHWHAARFRNLVKFTNIPHSTRKFHQKSTLRGAVLHCRCTLLN